MANATHTGRLEIDTLHLKEGPITLDQTIDLKTLKERLQYVEYDLVPLRARVHLEVRQVGDGAVVKGRLDARFETQCGTCLADTSLSLEPEVSAYFTQSPGLEGGEEDVELTPEELAKECFDGQKLKLDDLVYDTLMLELPMTPKCGPNCKGLLEETEASSRNDIDPRLAPLASVRIEKER